MDKPSHVNTPLKIFIYSPQTEISQIISDNLCGGGNQCVVFETLDNLSSMIKNMSKGPDLLLLDYTTFNHDIFNIHAYLKKINKVFPVVFYNDPCLTRSTRAGHWKAMLELTQSKTVQTDLSKYDQVFNKLAELIESEEFSPYISLLQPPKKVPENLIKDKYTLQYLKDNSDDCITSFKKRNKLPHNLFFLLKLLQKNKDFSMHIKQIIDLYEMEGKSISEKSLKVLISQLKRRIRLDKECEFLINQDHGTYRFIRFKY